MKYNNIEQVTFAYTPWRVSFSLLIQFFTKSYIYILVTPHSLEKDEKISIISSNSVTLNGPSLIENSWIITNIANMGSKIYN